MKPLALLAILFTSVSSLVAQTDKPIDSRITDVTVFLNKAQISREAKTRIEAGKTNLILRGLTSQLDQQSIQVAGKGNFIILGIAHQQNYLSEHNMPPRLRNMKDSLELAQQQVQLENSQREILNKEEQMLLSNQKIGGTDQSITAAELKAMADFFRNRLTEIVTARMKIDQRIKKLNEAIVRLRRQINEESSLYSRNTSEIVISVSAEAATSVELTVNYIVANAGWQAVYDLRALNTKSPVQLSYKANVFQNTGEEWKNVRLKLSTANPALGGLKPELYTWKLDFYYPPQFKNKLSAAGAIHRSMEAPSARDDERPEEIVVAPKPAGEVSDYVSTVQTSLSTEFDIALPYTVNPSNKPTLVDIRNHELKAIFSYAAAPKLDLDAFLIAKVIGWEEFNLLPGEANVFFEGTFVGNSFIDPNNIKDTLSVSMGRDKRIVIKREKLRDFSSRKFIGSNQRETMAYEISVRNTKTEPIDIVVEDQVPVSQNSQIEVTVLDVGGAKHNALTGKLAWDLSLQPNETRKLVYKFEVKYPKDRTVSGLE